MKKILTTLFAALILCCSIFSFVLAADITKSKQTIPQGATVFQRASLDITGDGIKDTITLLGSKFDKTSIYLKNIYLLVNTTLIEFPKESDGGYEPKFVLKDFNGDKLPDIFVSSATGGSGGIINTHIYSLKGGKVKLLFSPSADSALIIKGAFQPNYIVKFTVAQTNKTFTLDVSRRKSAYDDPQIKLYKDGKLLRKEEISTDYYGLLTPVDVDKDGIYELQGIQAIWGIAHVDTLAQVKSTWKWVNDKWKVINTEVVKIPDEPESK